MKAIIKIMVVTHPDPDGLKILHGGGGGSGSPKNYDFFDTNINTKLLFIFNPCAMHYLIVAFANGWLGWGPARVGGGGYEICLCSDLV